MNLNRKILSSQYQNLRRGRIVEVVGRTRRSRFPIALPVLTGPVLEESDCRGDQRRESAFVLPIAAAFVGL